MNASWMPLWDEEVGCRLQCSCSITVGQFHHRERLVGDNICVICAIVEVFFVGSFTPTCSRYALHGNACATLFCLLSPLHCSVSRVGACKFITANA